MNVNIDTYPNLKDNWNPWKSVFSDDKNSGNPLKTETLAPLLKNKGFLNKAYLMIFILHLIAFQMVYIM